jgi:hypothetical protein
MGQLSGLMKGKDGNKKIKSMIHILDSMTDDGTFKKIFVSFIFQNSTLKSLLKTFLESNESLEEQEKPLMK